MVAALHSRGGYPAPQVLEYWLADKTIDHHVKVVFKSFVRSLWPTYAKLAGLEENPFSPALDFTSNVGVAAARIKFFMAYSHDLHMMFARSEGDKEGYDLWLRASTQTTFRFSMLRRGGATYKCQSS